MTSNLWRRAQVAWRRAGLNPIGLHEARHTFASTLIAAGVNAKAITTYMGHASIQTTYDLYGKLMPGSEAEIGRARRRIPRREPTRIRARAARALTAMTWWRGSRADAIAPSSPKLVEVRRADPRMPTRRCFATSSRRRPTRDVRRSRRRRGSAKSGAPDMAVARERGALAVSRTKASFARSRGSGAPSLSRIADTPRCDGEHPRQRLHTRARGERPRRTRRCRRGQGACPENHRLGDVVRDKARRSVLTRTQRDQAFAIVPMLVGTLGRERSKGLLDDYLSRLDANPSPTLLASVLALRGGCSSITSSSARTISSSARSRMRARSSESRAARGCCWCATRCRRPALF